MLSLKPRFDLFKFNFPKDFIPEELQTKYNEVLQRNTSVIDNCVDYLNESIQAINFPGISVETNDQDQRASNPIQPANKGKTGLGRINVDTKHTISYSTIFNPLDVINKEFKVTCRLNQGLYNYFLLYETFFYAICKHINDWWIPVFYIDLMDETGRVVSRIKLEDIVFSDIDGLDFNFSQLEREMKTFDVSFKFNNIDFDFVDDVIF